MCKDDKGKNKKLSKAETLNAPPGDPRNYNMLPKCIKCKDIPKCHQNSAANFAGKSTKNLIIPYIIHKFCDKSGCYLTTTTNNEKVWIGKTRIPIKFRNEFHARNNLHDNEIDYIIPWSDKLHPDQALATCKMDSENPSFQVRHTRHRLTVTPTSNKRLLVSILSVLPIAHQVIERA